MTRRRVLYEFDDTDSDQEAQRKAATVGATNGWELQQMYVRDQWRELPLDPTNVPSDMAKYRAANPAVPATAWEDIRGH
jgi:hypothetical protein